MSEPIPMLLWCPSCGARHVDAGEFATKPHHTHACQSCGMVWRPAIVPTCGVLFLPGFKDGLQRPTLEHYAAATDVLAGALGLVDEARSLVTKLAAADDTALAHCCSPGCSAKPTWWQGRNGVDAYGHWCDEHLPELLTGEVRRRLAMTGEAEAEGVELPEGSASPTALAGGCQPGHRGRSAACGCTKTWRSMRRACSPSRIGGTSRLSRTRSLRPLAVVLRCANCTAGARTPRFAGRKGASRGRGRR